MCWDNNGIGQGWRGGSEVKSAQTEDTGSFQTQGIQHLDPVNTCTQIHLPSHRHTYVHWNQKKKISNYSVCHEGVFIKPLKLDEKSVREAEARIQGRGQGQPGLRAKFQCIQWNPVLRHKWLPNRNTSKRNINTWNMLRSLSHSKRSVNLKPVLLLWALREAMGTFLDW